jgi:hypothetical protein
MGVYYDTLKVYLTPAGSVNPLRIPLIGTANTPPYVHSTLPSQSAVAGIEFSYQIPDSVFLDSDEGDSLSYSVLGIPPWLQFNDKTKSFRGTPPQSSIGMSTITVKAADKFFVMCSTTFTLTVLRSTALGNSPDIPLRFSLDQNFPNPFNPSTTINFTLAEDGFVSLRIFDVLGREVMVLVHDELKAGVLHSATFQAGNLGSGMYLCRLESGKNIQTRKILLVR